MRAVLKLIEAELNFMTIWNRGSEAEPKHLLLRRRDSCVLDARDVPDRSDGGGETGSLREKTRRSQGAFFEDDSPSNVVTGGGDDGDGEGGEAAVDEGLPSNPLLNIPVDRSPRIRRRDGESDRR